MTVEKSEWSDAELEHAVDAYLWMLNEEIAARPYNKSEVNRKLREGSLAGRSRASIEYRMQNISAALQELCLPRIDGYLPAKNIGARVKDKISGILAMKRHIDPADYAPSSDTALFEQKVVKLRSRLVTGIPRGIKNPQRSTGTVTSYLRDPLVKAWVLNQADGRCEGCLKPAPFMTSDGTPYLEVHHVVPLSEGGPDEISNTVALCPNCHRKAHFARESKAFLEELYRVVSRLK